VRASVRQAKTSDLQRLAELGRAAVAAGAYTDIGFNDDDFIEFASSIMNRPDSLVLVAEKEDGRVCGGIGIFVVPFYFNRAHTFIQEVFLWTDYPGTGHLLMRAVERLAKARGAKQIMITLNTNTKRYARASQYLSTNGYKHNESIYMRVL